MGIFDNLGRPAQPQQRQQMNPQQSFQQLQRNPASFLGQVGLNVPENMSDPNQIINYLTQSGQLPQSRYQQAMQMMQRFMGR